MKSILKTYKSYQKLTEPYFSFSELVAFPILPIVAVSFISFVVLYFLGLTAMIVVDAVIAFFANAYYHGLKNATPNGSSYSGSGSGISIDFVLSYVVILGVLLTANVGGYVFYLFLQTGVFHGLFFFSWLFVLIGITIIYFSSIQLKHTNELYDQARKFTPLPLDVVQDVDYLTCGVKIDFLQTQKELIAHINLSQSGADEHDHDTNTVSGRNKKLYKPVFSNTVQIPKDTNRLKISWYSITEDIYYADEMDFPFQLLDYVESKYPTDLPKVLRGERTGRVIFFLQLGGKILLLNKDKIIIHSTVLKSESFDEEQKNDWIGSAARQYGINDFKKDIVNTNRAPFIAQREALRDYVCDWKVIGTGLEGHHVEIKDVVLNYKTSDPIALDTFEKRRLPILFDIDYHKLSWLFIHIDAEKLYALILSSANGDPHITFDVAVDLESGGAVLIVKNNDVVLPFTAWEKVIDPYRYKEAKDYLVANLDSNKKNDFLKRIYEFIVEKDYLKAEALCAEALQTYPFFPMVYFYKARLLWYAEGYEASYTKQSYFIEKTKQEPYASAQIYNHFGCLYDDEKLYAESLACFEQAYEIHPDQLFYLANIAEVHYKLKDAKKALQVANACLSKGCTLDILREIISNKGMIG